MIIIVYNKNFMSNFLAFRNIFNEYLSILNTRLLHRKANRQLSMAGKQAPKLT